MKTNNTQELLGLLEKSLVPVTRWHQKKGSPISLRLQRAVENPFKSIVYLVSKFYPRIIVTKTFFDAQIYCRLPEHFYFYFFGFFVNDTSEAGLTRIMITTLKKGDTFLDIGSNCGLYSLLASELVNNDGEVHAFEPTPSTFKLLKKSVESYKNITINNTALLDHRGETHFYVDDKYSVANSIYKTLDTQKKCKVQAETLDAYCKDNAVAPTFMKIDAEGAEASILRGSVETLKRHSPIIVMELLEELENVTYEAVETLTALGYHFARIEADGSTKQLTMLDLKTSDVFDGEGFVNLLFTKS